MGSNGNLPLELILCVVEGLAPSTATVLRQDDPITQTIKAFTLVCRATYPVALKLLYTHCLHIDTSNRLCGLLVALERHIPQSYHVNHEDYSEDNISLNPPTNSSTLPQIDILPHIQNLYLAPYPRYHLDDFPVSQWIFELFSLARHTLRKLTIDIPLASLQPEQDHLNVRPRLSLAFSQLTALEEFASLSGDNIMLLEDAINLDRIADSQIQTPLWAKWPKLRKLQLRECDLLSGNYRHFEKLPQLENLVLFRPHFSKQRNWEQFLERLTRQRSRQVKVTFLSNDRSYSVPGRERCGHGSDVLQWVRVWNTEHHHDLDLDQVDPDTNNNLTTPQQGSVTHLVPRESKVHFSVVAINPLHDAYMKTWAREQVLNGTLWDAARNPRLRRSEFDQDVWLDDSVVDRKRVGAYGASEWSESWAGENTGECMGFVEY